MDKSEVVEKLKRRFGLGTQPNLRLALYERLGRICEGEDGEEAVHVIATVADDAAKATTPDRYFAWVVMRRLQDRGLLEAPQL